MPRVFLLLIATIALGFSGWFGIHALGGNQPLASVPIPIMAPENLPQTPSQWRGRIDYRALDRQLADLAQPVGPASDRIWQIPLAAPLPELWKRDLRVSVRDVEGNITRVVRTISTLPDGTLFTDGFATGTTAAWSATSP